MASHAWKKKKHSDGKATLVVRFYFLGDIGLSARDPTQASDEALAPVDGLGLNDTILESIRCRFYKVSIIDIWNMDRSHALVVRTAYWPGVLLVIRYDQLITRNPIPGPQERTCFSRHMVNK